MISFEEEARQQSRLAKLWRLTKIAFDVLPVFKYLLSVAAARRGLESIAAGACDYVMPDVGRIGGVTGWLQAAGIAAAHGIEMSSHLHPETSVHLLAASPTAHWIEYVDWADAILQEPLQVKDGAITAPNWPGTGIAWSEEKLRRLERI